MKKTSLTSVLVAIACGGLATVTVPSAFAESTSYRTLGRVSEDQFGRIETQWSGSGFDVVLDGTELTATIEDSGENFLTVEIDGVRAVLDLVPGVYVYKLFEGEAGKHRIKVTRRTSPLAGPTRFHDIRAKGIMSAPPAPSRRMMIIGDDIATAYGVDGAGPECGFSHATQNQSRSFAALTADRFGADLHTIAVDGRGLLRNWDNSDAPTMLELAGRTLPEQFSIWSTSRYQPNLIVVHLGTMDFSSDVPSGEFTEAYTSFLAELRAGYPGAMIVGAIGPNLFDDKRTKAVGAISRAVEARRATGDQMVQFIELTMKSSPRAWGCDWHPGIDAHAQMSQQLEDLIRAKLRW